MILIGSKFQVHKPSVLLVAVLINGVKKQVPQVSFETAAGDLISFQSFGSIVNLFISDLLSDMVLFGSNFKIQELSVMLVAALTNFGVKNQVPQFFFKFSAGDLVLVSSYEVDDISVLLVVVLINFVKKQVPQVSFKTAAGDLISFHSLDLI